MGSAAFLDGIALLDPVNGEGVGDGEDAQALESHAAEREKGRAKIGAASERAAAAVDNEVCGTRNLTNPFFQLVKILRRDGGPVENSARHVSVLKVSVEADADDNGLLGGVRGGVLFYEVRGLNDLSVGPRLGRIGDRRFSAVKREMHEAGNNKSDGGRNGEDFPHKGTQRF
jgi:hypothetical protein